MNKKFTLVEMLMVVAIILILISLLMPKIQHAKREAKLVLDLNNLKQSGSLVLMYGEDNEGRYPHGQEEPLWLGKNGLWYNTGVYNVKNRPLNKYLSSSLTNESKIELGQCPFDDGLNGYYNSITGGSSYAGNSNFYGHAFMGTTKFGPNSVKQLTIVKPSSFLVLSEFSIKGELWFSHANYGVTYHSSSTGVNINEAPVLFGDGHVRNITLPVNGQDVNYGSIITASRYGGNNTSL